jgi:hypothetical protein
MVSVETKMDNSSGITGLTLIIYIISIVLIFVVLTIAYERYFAPSINNRTLVRIILFGFMFNFAILFFLIMSFNKVKFAPGPQGPSGIRGRPGRAGNPDTISGCVAPAKKLNKLRNEQRKANQALVFEKPVLGRD